MCKCVFVLKITKNLYIVVVMLLRVQIIKKTKKKCEKCNLMPGNAEIFNQTCS